METIISGLNKDHKKFRRYLNSFEQEIDKLRVGDDPDYELLTMLAEYFSHFPDKVHHTIEDIIYDAVAAKTPDPETFLNLRAEHESLAREANAFQESVEQMLAGQLLPREEMVELGCAFVDRQRQHMRKEELTFFPIVEGLLTKAGEERILNQVKLIVDDFQTDKDVSRVHKIEENLAQDYGI